MSNQLREIQRDLENLQNQVDKQILSTPSGEILNKLTDININIYKNLLIIDETIRLSEINSKIP